MSHDIEIPISFGVVRGLQYGVGFSTRVLAVHGWLDNAASFSEVAAKLRDIHIVAVDLPGHGLSDHRAAGSNYHFVDYVSDLVEVADGLGWDTFHLFGHSLGAGIGSLLAVAVPNRVLSLVLIDGLGPVSGDEDSAPDRLRRAIKFRTIFSNKMNAIYPSIQSAVDMRLKKTRMHAHSARMIVERNLERTQGGYMWRTDRRVTYTSPVYMTEPVVHALLASIECPVKVIQASNGFMKKHALSQARIDKVQNVEVYEFPGSHHLHMDDPGLIAKNVARMLAEND